MPLHSQKRRTLIKSAAATLAVSMALFAAGSALAQAKMKVAAIYTVPFERR